MIRRRFSFVTALPVFSSESDKRLKKTGVDIDDVTDEERRRIFKNLKESIIDLE